MIRENYYKEIKNAMAEHGVEIWDSAMAGNGVRQAFWMKHKFMRYSIK